MAVKRLANGVEIDKSVNAINYTEFIVKKKPAALNVVIKIILAVAFAALVVFFFVKIWWLGSIAGMILVPLGIWLFSFFDTTFYYETESGELSVVERHGAAKKKPLKVRYSEMEKIAPLNSDDADAYDGFKGYVEHDFTSHKSADDDYFGVWTDEKGKNHVIKFQCTTSLMKIMKHYNKRGTVEKEYFSR